MRLVHGRVVTGLGDEVIEDGCVEIADGRIVAVGPAGGGGGAEEIDVGGATILPGLIDAHTHLFYGGLRSLQAIAECSPAAARANAVENAARTLAAGFTTVREVGCIGNLSVELRDEIAAGALVGPRIVASARILTSTSGPLPGHRLGTTRDDGFALLAAGRDELADAARAQVRDGVDNVKLMASGLELHPAIGPDVTVLEEDEIRAAVEVAHAAGRTVAVHCQSLESAKRALRAGADTIEHGTALDAECCELFLRSGAVLVPTLSTPASVRELGERLGLAAHQRAQTEAIWARWHDSLRLARAAGVPVAVGGDIGNRFPAGTNAREIQLLVEQGSSPLEAIRGATSVAARAIGRGDELGALAPGRLADVLVVDGDPLRDVAVLRDRERIRSVFKGGRVVAGTTAGAPAAVE
jgi:imidazolonepropionase-like amidohydrolase